MSLRSLLESPPRIEVIPEIHQRILAEVRQRYFEDIDPEDWHAYFANKNDDPRFQGFLESAFRIVEQSIQTHLPGLPRKESRYLRDIYFEEAQSFWYEYSRELQPILDFSERLLRESQKAVKDYFPKAERAFGPMAQSLLLDIEFQYAFYRYCKIAKPDLVDLRRIINIAGQMVESIFYSKIFQELFTLGNILRELERSLGSGHSTSKARLARFKKRNALVSKGFLSNLRIIEQKRNEYSHGWTSDQNVEADFHECITALLRLPNGVLHVLYDVLK